MAPQPKFLSSLQNSPPHRYAGRLDPALYSRQCGLFYYVDNKESCLGQEGRWKLWSCGTSPSEPMIIPTSLSTPNIEIYFLLRQSANKTICWSNITSERVKGQTKGKIHKAICKSINFAIWNIVLSRNNDTVSWQHVGKKIMGVSFF